MVHSAANLANYYAGMSYLNLKDYQNAVTYLGDFSSDDKMLGPIAKGGIGDAFVQLDQKEDALEYYEKAFSANINDFTTPLYLMKAANVAIDLGQNDKALGYLKRIKSEFSTSIEVYSSRCVNRKSRSKLINMATANHNLSNYDKTTIPNAKDFRFGIVVSEWNDTITEGLWQGAFDALN